MCERGGGGWGWSRRNRTQTNRRELWDLKVMEYPDSVFHIHIRIKKIKSQEIKRAPFLRILQHQMIESRPPYVH
jgi:hypothetical protein